LGGGDAAVVERVRDRHAGELELGLRQTFAECGLPDADDRRVVGERTAHHPLNSVGRRSMNAATPSFESSVWLTSSTYVPSARRNDSRSSVSASCIIRFAHPIAFVGPDARRSAHSFAAA